MGGSLPIFCLSLTILTHTGQGAAMASAVVLLPKTWVMNDNLMERHMETDMKHVHTCMDVLKRLESQCVQLQTDKLSHSCLGSWHAAGQLGDNLRRLLNINGAPFNSSSATKPWAFKRDGAVEPYPTSLSGHAAVSSTTNHSLREQLYDNATFSDHPSHSELDAFAPHTTPASVEGMFPFTFEWPPAPDAGTFDPSTLPAMRHEVSNMTDEDVSAWLNVPLSGQ
jgi:hypothetical protein